MFVHLRTHSDYSLLKSVITIPELVKHLKQLDMPAVALTDYNSMGGVIELAKQCKLAKIKPIFGVELEIEIKKRRFILPLLAESTRGYQLLLRLTSKPKPLTLDDFDQETSGVIALSGGKDGVIYHLMANNAVPEAVRLYREQIAIFGKENFFLELTVDTAEERQISNLLVQSFPSAQFVATQDVVCLSSHQLPALKVLRAIDQGRPVAEIDVTQQPIRSAKEMSHLYSKIPQAIDNTVAIAKRCQTDLTRCQGFPQLPNSPKLEELVWQGAKQRYSRLTPEIEERISQELKIIQARRLDDYFVIVADIVNYARSCNIAVGPGRGSAASSVVAYCLGITELDPIRYQLVFERFLNPERQNLPDIDIDFCHNRRDEVLQYVKRRFGQDRVAHIGTYGTFGLRLAVREVGRMMDYPKRDLDRLLTNLPKSESEALGVLGKRLAGKPRLFELVKHLHGLKRHFSTHAAGIVLSPSSLGKLVAVEPNDQLDITQAPMDSLEEIGLLKMDFLALRTLTILQEAESRVKEINPNFSLRRIGLQDRTTYQLLSEGRSVGVFQLESEMFQDLLRQLKPSRFEELIALLALGRPGPLGYIPTYIRRKDKLEEVEYPHPELEPILGETYGLMVYQEQVMQVAHVVGGFTMAEADLLRISMSKKDKQKISGLKDKFIGNALKLGLSRQAAEKLYQDMIKFSDYAFNKAHSCCYALLSYQCAYLKAHYPCEFFAAVLNTVNSIDRLRDFLQDAQAEGLEVFPPDVRFSEQSFIKEGSGIRYGLAHIRNFGSHGSKKIIEARKQRKFDGLSDFLDRVELTTPAKESLLLAGALDCFGERLELGKQLGMNLTRLELLRQEKEIVGMYFSDHPASRWNPFLKQLRPGFARIIAGEVGDLRERNRVWYGKVWGEKETLRFRMKNSVGNGLKEKSLMVLGGAWANDILDVELVFPLKPLLLCKPRADQLIWLKENLLRFAGDFPVILQLGNEALQLLPREFWVEPSTSLQASLHGAHLGFTWVDPWGELERELTKN